MFLPEIPDEQPSLPEIPGEDTPPVDIPYVPPTDEPEAEPPSEDVPLTDVPRTGDSSAGWYVTFLLSACGLAVMGLFKKFEAKA